ncbi:MAG: acyl carrier protein [Nitrosomonas sp.]|nr:acyl carrier protein [Nitrosomonas sp.]MDP1951381.1 acyl carrier protein [Nitrosomonas sp.]
MTIEAIEQRLSEIFRDVLDRNTLILARETTAADIEEWDSLAHISLLVAIEKEFDIKLTLDEVEQLRNVGDMFDLIQRKAS